MSPKATILQTASTVNMARKTGSVSCCGIKITLHSTHLFMHGRHGGFHAVLLLGGRDPRISFKSNYLKFTNFWLRTVSSFSGRRSSMAMTTQLAKIVVKMVYSKGGQRMMNRLRRRTKLLSVNTMRDEGPGGEVRPPG